MIIGTAISVIVIAIIIAIIIAALYIETNDNRAELKIARETKVIIAGIEERADFEKVRLLFGGKNSGNSKAKVSKALRSGISVDDESGKTDSL